MKRVVSVLSDALAKSKSGWLVGDKCTYVDLAFFMWDENIEPIMAPFEGEWDPAQFRKSFPMSFLPVWYHVLGSWPRFGSTLH